MKCTYTGTLLSTASLTLTSEGVDLVAEDEGPAGRDVGKVVQLTPPDDVVAELEGASVKDGPTGAEGFRIAEVRCFGRCVPAVSSKHR